MTSVQHFSAQWLPAIEATLRRQLAGGPPEAQGMYAMMRYHMGWEDALGQPEQAPQGKRVRPLVVLMACLAAGGAPEQALPAAAAVELVHNFSLIHDDIEDGSPTRRHRATLWTLAGQPQAINAGDAMFTLARLALLGLGEAGVADAKVLRCLHLFDRTCLHLTEGQYQDMSFETRPHVTPAEYLVMIAGKTAALLAASAQLGALVASEDVAASEHYWRFGHELGLSFQVQDDILGIWGDEALTGKSAASDILTRKKTLPVLYALAQPGPDGEALREIYASAADLEADDLPTILRLLDRLGARSHAEAAAGTHAAAALAALEAAGGGSEGTALLRELALALLGRQT